MTRGYVLALGFLIALAAFSCSQDEEHVNGIDDAGGTGPHCTEPSPCVGPNAFPLPARRFDEARSCIDTDVTIDGVACTLTPEPDDPDRYHSDGYSCLKRLSDGAMFWVFAFYRLGFDPCQWARCPDAPLLPPKGCYAADCPSGPRSTCSLAKTKEWFDCGREGEFDENCCGRAPCEDADCSDGETCIAVPTIGQIDCWQTSNDDCDCGGPYGGPSKMLCMPIANGGAGGQGGT